MPEPRFESEISIEEALQNRRSRRSFRDEPLSLSDISQILWAAYGITRPIKNRPAFLRGGLKTAPSAGALYPLELYVVVGNVTNLADGVYKYKPESHSLLMISKGDKREKLAVAAYNQTWLVDAPASIVYSAVFERTTKKYGKRGRERYVCIELGHSAENIYLQCESMDMATCVIGAFDDMKVKQLLPMPQAEEPLYIMPIGKKK